jgi:uncharacterized membrane protein (UPF0127 family)
MLQLINKTSGGIVASNVTKASSLWARTKGLLGTDSFAAGQAMWIVPCKSIHTFFMNYSIDVVFIAESGEVVGVYQDLPPFRASNVFWKAHSVIELPAGTLATIPCSIGDVLEVSEIAD